MKAVHLIGVIWSPKLGEHGGTVIPVAAVRGNVRTAVRSVRFWPQRRFGTGAIFGQRIQYDTTHADAGIVGTREQVDAYLRRQEARCDS